MLTSYFRIFDLFKVKLKPFLYAVIVLTGAQCHIAIAQEKESPAYDRELYKPQFKPIDKTKVESGTELVIKLEASNKMKTSLYYSFSWDFGGVIDQEENLFKWTPGSEDTGIYPIIFTAKDPVTGQETNQPAIVEIIERRYEPSLKVISSSKSLKGFITLDELEEFALIIQASDRNQRERLYLDYFINNKPKLHLPNATFEVNDRRATFIWRPDNDQAKQRTFNITFQVRDETDLISRISYQVLVNDIDHPPVFRNPTKDYYIDEGKQLTFSVKATDQDDDAIFYDIQTPDIKRGDFSFNHQTGKFQWMPDFSYAKAKTQYDLVFSASDGMLTDFDTISIRVDPKNYPPKIEPMAEKVVKENTALVIKLDVEDLNGNEDLILTAEAEFDGFEFDDEKGIFSWKPPFSFVNGFDKRKVTVKFTAFDGQAEDVERVTITVYDREDPEKLIKNYQANLRLAQDMDIRISEINRHLETKVKKKKFWNTFFDVSTVVLGAFTGVASSSLVGDSFRQTAAPIGSAMTTLIGLNAILDKEKAKPSELNWKMITLQTDLNRSTSAMMRKYGEEPSPEITDSSEFKKDLSEFERTVTSNEIEKDKLVVEYTKLKGN